MRRPLLLIYCLTALAAGLGAAAALLLLAVVEAQPLQLLSPEVLVSTLIGLLAGVVVYRLAMARWSLRSLRSTHEAVLHSMGDGLYVLDATGRIRYTNPAAERILGFDADEMIGRNAHQLFHDPSGQAHPLRCPILEAARTGEPYQNSEEYFRHKSGRAIPVDVTATPLPGRRGHAGVVTLFRDISERKRWEEELRALNRELQSQALQDGLTGLANRRALETGMQREWRRAMRTGRSLSVIMLDVDKFKPYNDHFGHPQGDEVLKTLARILEENARRPGDLAARYGGEEFTLMLPGNEEAGSRQVAEEIRQAMLDARIRQAPSGGSPYVTVSLGVAVVVAPRQHSPEQALAAADAALYEAKQAGRNRVRVTVME